jgi:hypothetical protein
MSWLEDYAEKFAKEEAEKKAKEDAEKKFLDSWNETVRKSLNDFVKDKLQCVVDRKTKDGKTINIKLEDCKAQMFADNDTLLELSFYLGEHEEYDRDGCKWGNGHYYVCKKVRYLKEFKSKYGSKLGGPDRYFDSLDEEDVARYLLGILND